LLLTLPFLIVAVVIGIMLLGQSAPPTSEQSPPPGSPAQPALPNILVVPEVPLGPITVLVACFVALLIAQKRAKSKP